MRRIVLDNLVSCKEYLLGDLPEITEIWNDVVEAGNAFPQDVPLSEKEARDFFEAQSYTGVAEMGGEIVGVYILHPNNVGRCGHIANASFAVRAGRRGLHIGEEMVRDCLRQAKRLGFRILQFNAVVSKNTAAIRLYEKLGFEHIGTVREGYCRPDGCYEDIELYYYTIAQEQESAAPQIGAFELQ